MCLCSKLCNNGIIQGGKLIYNCPCVKCHSKLYDCSIRNFPVDNKFDDINGEVSREILRETQLGPIEKY